jgi:hypothetical protein
MAWFLYVVCFFCRFLLTHARKIRLQHTLFNPQPDSGQDQHARRRFPVRFRKEKNGFQPFPNTDPGLAGETGVSGEEGTMYGVDGLKTGGGSKGALLGSGPR